MTLLEELKNSASAYAHAYPRIAEVCARAATEIDHSTKELSAKLELIDDLRRQNAELQKELIACLELEPNAVRCCESGGPENVAASIAITMAKVRKQNAELREACKLYREASFQNHSGHWDDTMQHGRGCPECIRARELREKADKALAAQPEGGAK